MHGDTGSEDHASLRSGDEVARDAEDGPLEELVDVTGDDRPPSRYAGLVEDAPADDRDRHPS